jgi:hypothetical protein
VEKTEAGPRIKTTVYFCMKHGFFHASETQPLAAGMESADTKTGSGVIPRI